MGMPEASVRNLWPVLLLLLGAWLIELFGLGFLQRSCSDHAHGEPAFWASGAQLPYTHDCMKLYRWLWWAVWFEFPFAVFLLVSLIGKNARSNLRRWRFPLMACLAIATLLQMWAANVTLNLTDTEPARYLTSTERLRARVAFVGFCLLSAINIVTIFVLGDDGDHSILEEGYDVLSGTPGLAGLDRPVISTTTGAVV